MNKIAFYAPIKPPDHPIASGDRLIAQNTIKALQLVGFEVELASRFIAYSKREAADILEQRKADALVEAEAVLVRMDAVRPDLWLTYHPYCKAPDWIGPRVSASLGIPYVTLEAARTGQGFEAGGDRWASWRIEAQTGIKAADAHLVFKPTDRSYLEELLGSDKALVDIAPFIDVPAAPPKPVSLPRHWRPGTPVLVTVAMMRPGKKIENFRLIAQALASLKGLNWNLIVIGDGPEAPHVQQLFEDFSPERLLFTGALPHEDVLSHLAASDIFLWPGWKEPIGMVYLEAQMTGLPVAALESMGVPLVVRHGETGLLAAEDDLTGFVDNLATLISHPSLRNDFGTAAKTAVRRNHSLAAAGERLRSALAPLLSKGWKRV